MNATPSTLRFVPPDWVHPFRLDAVFGHAPARLEVDLGCGKGRFLLAQAARHPDTAWLGLDRHLERLESIERRARRAGLRNMRLLYAEAHYTLRYLLPPRCVATYYIFFPDPWPKRRHQEHRLFDPAFLDALERTLVADGAVHIATDALDYGERIRRIFRADPRFSPAVPFEPDAEERTDFEIAFLGLGKPIGRCSYVRTKAGQARLPIEGQNSAAVTQTAPINRGPPPERSDGGPMPVPRQAGSPMADYTLIHS